MNSIDPTGKYYVNIIASRNEVQFFTLPSLKLESLVSLEPDIEIVKAIWTSSTSKTKRRHDSENTESSPSHTISCLTTSNTIVSVGLGGVLDTIAVKQDLNDITFFNGSIWGCFDGGIIDIGNSLKPIRHKGDMRFIAASEDLLVGAEKLYKFNKKFSEVYEMEAQHIFEDIVYNDEGFYVINKSQWVDSVGILKINKFDDHFVAFKHDRIELFNSDYEVVNTIKVNVAFEDLWQNGEDVYLVCNVDNRPLLHKISTLLESLDIAINIELPQPEVVMLDSNNEVIDEILDSVVVKNVPSSEAYKKLNKALSNDDTNAVIELCSTTNDESSISTVIDNLNSVQVDKLFQILSEQIQSHILQSTNVSIWLKYILLKNKVNIAKEKKIAGLEKQLTGSLSLLPNLLAIKGRLQLLKSQHDLRNKSQQEDEDAVNGEMDATINSEAEESVYIANGENDEDDIQDVDEEEDGR